MTRKLTFRFVFSNTLLSSLLHDVIHSDSNIWKWIYFSSNSFHIEATNKGHLASRTVIRRQEIGLCFPRRFKQLQTSCFSCALSKVMSSNVSLSWMWLYFLHDKFAHSTPSTGCKFFDFIWFVEGEEKELDTNQSVFSRSSTPCTKSANM